MTGGTTVISDQQSLLNVLNSNAVMANGGVMSSGDANSPNGNNNVQYYFAMPANGVQNGQLQNISGIQGIQGLSNNIPLQSLQGLQGAQIILNSNGQPTIFVGNRDC